MKISRLLIFFAVVFAAAGCNSSTDPKKNLPAKTKEEGELLMETYCQRCHQLPDPSRLDKNTWKKHVLIRMSAFLGIFNDGVQYYDTLPVKWVEPGEGGERVLAAGIYPDKPLLSRSDWEKIRDFIVKKAPEKTFSGSDVINIPVDENVFKTKIFLSHDKYAPNVTSVKIDSATGNIYAGFYKQEINIVSTEGKVKSSYLFPEAPVQLLTSKERFVVVNIGNIKGVDAPKGTLMIASSFSALQSGKTSLKWEKLQRPVNVNFADLDQDGKEDILLCEFGNLVGDMAWFKNKGNGEYEKKLLFADDGATVSYIEDMNADQKPDIVALFANADEGIDIFLNQGEGVFEKKRVLRFDPSNGSTSLQLVDWDKDGDLDFLYGNGDNGDYPSILKPYHGVRLYINEGNMTFTEKFFLPMNGVYKVIANDYDLDGDRDIAALSFYPDFSSGAKEGFVLFRNNGNDTFSKSTVKGFDNSRWMVMDAGDADKDGDIDILIGAFNVPSSEVPEGLVKKWEEMDVPLLYLENQTKK